MKHGRIFKSICCSVLLSLTFCACAEKQKTDQTPEQLAASYLEAKYNKEFIVRDLEKKQGDVFKSRAYYGFAWPVDEPLERFAIRVENNQVQDSAYVLKWRDQYLEEAQALASKYFGTNEVCVFLESYDFRDPEPNQDQDKSLAECMKEHRVDGLVCMMVRSDQLNGEWLPAYLSMSDALRQYSPGWLEIYAASPAADHEFSASGDDAGSASVEHPLYNLLEEEPVFSCQFGISESVLKRYLEEASLKSFAD